MDELYSYILNTPPRVRTSPFSEYGCGCVAMWWHFWILTYATHMSGSKSAPMWDHVTCFSRTIDRLIEAPAVPQTDGTWVWIEVWWRYRPCCHLWVCIWLISFRPQQLREWSGNKCRYVWCVHGTCCLLLTQLLLGCHSWYWVVQWTTLGFHGGRLVTIKLPLQHGSVRLGLTTVPYTATAVQNTALYGYAPYRKKAVLTKSWLATVRLRL